MIGGCKIVRDGVLKCFPFIAILEQHQGIARWYRRDNVATQMLGRDLKELCRVLAIRSCLLFSPYFISELDKCFVKLQRGPKGTCGLLIYLAVPH